MWLQVEGTEPVSGGGGGLLIIPLIEGDRTLGVLTLDSGTAHRVLCIYLLTLLVSVNLYRPPGSGVSPEWILSDEHIELLVLLSQQLAQAVSRAR